jgi:hypothetical protein
MKYRLVVLLFVISIMTGYSQAKKTQPDIKDIKSQMVLRANTRDKMSIVKDNTHRSQMNVRRQIILSQQQKIMRQHMKQVKKQRIYRHRMLQLRKKRMEAARRHRFHNR